MEDVYGPIKIPPTWLDTSEIQKAAERINQSMPSAQELYRGFAAAGRLMRGEAEMTEAERVKDFMARNKQVGGNHYKGMAIQPYEYCHKNNLGYCESNAIKYLSRWKNKNGVEDLKKARHMIDLLIEAES